MSKVDPLIVTIDSETTIDPVHGPMPQYHKNRAIYLGITHDGSGGEVEIVKEDSGVDINLSIENYIGKMIDVKKPIILQGHNIKFDLLYAMRKSPFFIKELVENGTLLWDTMIVEYLLSGQSSKLPALNSLISKYLGSGYIKDNKVSDLFAQGIGADKIVHNIIIPYLKNDVRTTSSIADIQKYNVTYAGMTQLVITQMDALLAITEMEHNGLHIDSQALHNLITEYNNKFVDSEAKLENMVRANLEARIGTEALSGITTGLLGTKVLHALFYGGKLSSTTKQVVMNAINNEPIRYKSGIKKGLVKTVNTTKTIDIAPLITSTHLIKSLKGRDGKLSLDDDALTKIQDSGSNGAFIRTLAKTLKEFREASKMLSTYLEPIRDKMLMDGCVYGSINQAITSTGRTSSSGPNLQNMPSGDSNELKTVFNSRFGDGGLIVEIDYKQLEVIALALLSKCPSLMTAIRNGDDIHNITGSKVYKGAMTHDQRRVVKSVNFGLIYGGQANGIAAANDLPKHLVEDILKAFYDSFPGVAAWHKLYADYVTDKGVVYITPDVHESGKPVHAVEIKTPTGRKLTYKMFEPSWGSKVEAPSPTQMKNYPVQSLATADIVPMMLGILLKTIVFNGLYDDVKLICTVHDSVLLDIKKSALNKAIPILKETMESVPVHLKKNFNIETDLPFRVDIKAGPNWKDTKDIHEYLTLDI